MGFLRRSVLLLVRSSTLQLHSRALRGIKTSKPLYTKYIFHLINAG